MREKCGRYDSSPQGKTIFTDSEKYHLVDKQKSVKFHQNLVDVEN